ncbi:zinc finger protein 569-like [Engraulis encrasicolus]|uniref:zinc finger protein 569-like n=1 Tax=Engraulis encrasicolus TaxID=184585 RepID=UPI002FD17A2E
MVLPLLNAMDTSSTPPLASLRLLLSPVRLVSACLWQIVEGQHLEHYEQLENFVTLVTKIVPDVLSPRQTATLIMGLRAKVLLEMCRGDLPVDSETVKNHLQQMQSTDPVQSKNSEMDRFQTDFLNLILSLLEDPAKKEDFFQRVYPVEYGADFDKALQVLVAYFISRLELLLPTPNFKQVASWMSGSYLWDECHQYITKTEHLQHLIQHNSDTPLNSNALPSLVEERIISALSPATAVDSTHSQSISQKNTSSQLDDLLAQDSQGVNTTSDAASTADDQVSLASHNSVDHDYSAGPSSDLRDNEESSRTGGSIAAHGAQHNSTLSGDSLQMNATLTLPGQNARSSSSQQKTKGTVKGARRDATNTQTAVQSAGKGSKKCPHCSRSFSVISDLLRHLKYHQRPQLRASSKSSLYSCTTCTATFLSLASLQRHQTAMHSRVHKCSFCEQAFERMSELLRHMIMTHQGPDPKPNTDPNPNPNPDAEPATTSLRMTCDDEGPEDEAPEEDGPDEPSQEKPSPEKPAREVSARAKARAERRARAEAKAAATGPEEEGCKYCGKTFDTIIEQLTHEKTHMEMTPYHCRQCPKSFVTRSSMLRHAAKHTGKLPCLCDTCGKSYSSAEDLRRHINHCHSDGKHCCPHCGKMFSTAGNLNIHIRIHTGEKPYICETCGKAFKSAGDLQLHIRFHTGERPYKCAVCDKGFVSSSHRLTHSRMHTGEKPYQCSVCELRFARTGSLKSHMMTHTGEKKFTCPECPSRFRRTTQLRAHMERKHQTKKRGQQL